MADVPGYAARPDNAVERKTFGTWLFLLLLETSRGRRDACRGSPGGRKYHAESWAVLSAAAPGKEQNHGQSFEGAH